MADYSSLTEAQALVPAIGTLLDGATPTVPSLMQGGLILASVTGEINMHLRAKGYKLPIVDADALASLKTISQNGTAAKLLKATFPTTDGIGGDDGAFKTFREDYLAGLKFIDEGGLGADSTPEESDSRFAHGFRDSQATALSKSQLVTRTDLETSF